MVEGKYRYLIPVVECVNILVGCTLGNGGEIEGMCDGDVDRFGGK